jgi:hypothetical protein
MGIVSSKHKLRSLKQGYLLRYFFTRNSIQIFSILEKMKRAIKFMGNIGSDSLN